MLDLPASDQHLGGTHIVETVVGANHEHVLNFAGRLRHGRPGWLLFGVVCQVLRRAGFR